MMSDFWIRGTKIMKFHDWRMVFAQFEAKIHEIYMNLQKTWRGNVGNGKVKGGW